MYVNILEAKSKLYELINETASSHKPVVIMSENSNAILISEDDWNAINETLYLLSIPGMRESICEGLNTPIDECKETLDW